eukprot:PhM_4_TR8206/c0_g1_i1/m.2752
MSRLYRSLLRSACAIDRRMDIVEGASVAHLVANRARVHFENARELNTEADLQQAFDIGHTFDAGLQMVLHEPENHRALTSILRSLLKGYGDYTLKHTLEQGFETYVHFAAEQRGRREADSEALAERQNRVMQRAVVGFIGRLLEVSQSESNTACASSDAGTTTERLQLPEVVVVDIVDEWSKQTIYLKCDDRQFDRDDVERCETVSCEKLRDTVFHSETYAVALRIFYALLEETNLHRSRGTYIVGHGFSGGVATILALLLHSENFEIRNLITFGATRSVETTLERYKDFINSVRVVIAGDKKPLLPATGVTGMPFIHIGEVLTVHAPALPGASHSVVEYHTHLVDSEVPISYEEDHDDIVDDGSRKVGRATPTPRYES